MIQLEKHNVVMILIMLTVLLFGLTGCSSKEKQNIETEPGEQPREEESVKAQEEETMIPVNVIVNGDTYLAKFYNNTTSQAFINNMPLTIEMQDFNRNEKVHRFKEALPVDETIAPGQINNGDIMCWSSDSIVLFYESFQSSYGGYVRLGYIEEPEMLSDSLGSGNVEITFEIQE